MARELIQAKYRITPTSVNMPKHYEYDMLHVNTHLSHKNYKYYIKKSIEAFPGKEIFQVWTEHQWDDMVALDLAIIGGSSKSFGELPDHRQGSYGSQHYEPSPLTEEAIHKLCCVLEHEIELYFSLLDKVLNLDEENKASSCRVVRKKCALEDTGTSWPDWRRGCQH
jgi:hypothetical protein